MTEETKETMELSAEQLEELLGGQDSEPEKLPYIMIDLEDYDIEEFNRGIKETSYLAGKVTSLINCGLSEQAVIDLLLNQETIDYNIRAAQINKDMNVEVAKSQRTTQDKYEL